MTRRERVHRAMRYQSVDKAPLQYYYTPVGYYEHGEKLNDLFATLPGDFEPFRRMPIPKPPREEFDAQGNYHAVKRDDWGVVWQYRIYGVQGIPCDRPIRCAQDIANYHLPPAPALQGPEFDQYAEAVRTHQAQDYYTLGQGCLLYTSRCV